MKWTWIKIQRFVSALLYIYIYIKRANTPGPQEQSQLQGQSQQHTEGNKQPWGMRKTVPIVSVAMRAPINYVDGKTKGAACYEATLLSKLNVSGFLLLN